MRSRWIAFLAFVTPQVIVFYLEHRIEVGRYVAKYQAEIDRFRASG